MTLYIRGGSLLCFFGFGAAYRALSPFSETLSKEKIKDTIRKTNVGFSAKCPKSISWVVRLKSFGGDEM